MSKSSSAKAKSDSEKIDRLIAGITDWRGKTFAAVRKAILEADERDHRRMEVDGKPAVVARRHDRGRQRP